MSNKTEAEKLPEAEVAAKNSVVVPKEAPANEVEAAQAEVAEKVAEVVGFPSGEEIKPEEISEKQESEEKPKAKKIPNPLAIQIESVKLSGDELVKVQKTFASKASFEQSVRDRLKGNEENEELKKALEEEEKTYFEAYRQKLEEIKEQCSKATQQVKRATKFKKNPNNPDAKEGIVDIMKPFEEAGLVIPKQNGGYEVNPTARYAETLVDEAHKRMRLLYKFMGMENSARKGAGNYFVWVDKGSKYACKIETKEDDRTGEKMYKISDLTIVYGTCPFQEGIVEEGRADNRLKLAAAKATAKPQNTEKKGGKNKKNGKGKGQPNKGTESKRY